MLVQSVNGNDQLGNTLQVLRVHRSFHLKFFDVSGVLIPTQVAESAQTVHFAEPIDDAVPIQNGLGYPAFLCPPRYGLEKQRGQRG